MIIFYKIYQHFLLVCWPKWRIHVTCAYQHLHWRRNRGARPPTPKKGGPAPYLAPPPTFHGSPLSALPSVYQFFSCHTLGSTALALVCVRGHFRVLENEKFSTPCERETPPTPSPTQSLRSLICVPPTFKYVAMPMTCTYRTIYFLINIHGSNCSSWLNVTNMASKT